MVNFLQKRLQVFVSSTYIDLIEERQAAVEAILGAGHIPAGMELFTAGDESQMAVIKQWIDESDVYLLILGGRYGSIDQNTGKSYTHLEYNYALESQMPLFSCVLKDPQKRVREKKKEDLGKFFELDNQPKFQDFRNIVISERVVKFWEDKKDIKLEITNALNDFSRRDNIIGWVRGNQQVNLPSVTEEMTRLSKENAELSKENAELREKLNNQASVTYAGLTYDELKNLLLKSEITDEDIETFTDWRQQGVPEFKDELWINKDLLTFFIFLSNFLLTSEFPKFMLKRMSTIEELEKLGLIFFNLEIKTYNLTQDGIAFLNKMKSLNEVDIEFE